MKKAVSLTCQDWYRVRRGEDDMAWGRGQALDGAPRVRLSRRAARELAFLEPDRREAVASHLAQTAADPYGERSCYVLRGAGRWLTRVGDLRIVFRVDPDNGTLLVSTIRGGAVLDPEAVGPPPR